MERKSSLRLNSDITSSNGDRLIDLHDSLLSDILSRLPTKDAVRTSVLSKDWKRKWKNICNVDTDIHSWGKLGGFTFCSFLNEILVSHDHLRRFRTTFWCGMSRTVQGWINAAMEHNLEYLDVNINTNDIGFPISLLNSNSLRELRVVKPLSLPVKVTVGEKNRALNLTSLSFYGVAFLNRNLDSSNVSFDFPALQRLEFRGAIFSYYKWKNVKSVEIYAPSLVSFLFEPTLVNMLWPCDYSTKIVAPRLTSFSCFDGLPENLIFDGSSVISAFLSSRDNLSTRLNETFGTRATYLLNRFTNLEELTLGGCVTEVLVGGPPLHHHDKLKSLTLLSGSTADQLFKLLHDIPSLKFFSVNVDKWEDYNYEVMEITPSCIASDLEEVVLQVFSGQVPQYNLAEFLLKTAKNLKKMTITTNDIGASKEMKKVLSAFACCSPSLAICSRLPDVELTYKREEAQPVKVGKSTLVTRIKENP